MSVKNCIRYVAGKFSFFNNWMISKKIGEKTKYLLSKEEVERGEYSTVERDKILEKQSAVYTKYIEQFNAKAKAVIDKCLPESSNDLQKVCELCKDMLWCNLAYGFQPDEYIMFGFMKKENTERKKFISDTDRYVIYYKNNNFYDRMVFIDKYKTYQKFEKYYKRKMVRLQSKSDFNIFSAFVKEYPEFVLKKPDLSQGNSVELCRITDYSAENMEQNFNQFIQEGTVILEERIDQAEELKVLHPASVNTLRCTTIFTGGNVSVFFPFIKVGQSGSFVDNGGKGGILAAIDIQTGVICSDGIDENGYLYIVHPDTGITFKGYALPKWGECMELVKECASKIPTVRIIGWDVAWTKDGWVIVEGNAQGQFVGQQGTIKKGLKEELLRALN